MQCTEDSEGTPYDIWPWSEPVLPWHHCHIIDSHRLPLSFLLCCQGEWRQQLLKFSSFTWLYCCLRPAILKTTMCLDSLFMQFFPNRIFSRQLGCSVHRSPDLWMENRVRLWMGQCNACSCSWRTLVKDLTVLINHKHVSPSALRVLRSIDIEGNTDVVRVKKNHRNLFLYQILH